MKKDLDSLLEQALENIKNDRQTTEQLLTELQEYLSGARERYADSGATAAKFVETLQRTTRKARYPSTKKRITKAGLGAL
mgnify:CR=1 FL=1